jgi:hypothetical protein
LRGPVNHKARFIVLGLLYAGVLFGALQWLTLRVPSAWWLKFAVAAVAVMLAAVGVPWRRKLLFAGVTAIVTVGLVLVMDLSGLGSAADVLASADAQDATNVQLAAFALVQLFFLGAPLAALALFVGRQPSVLWTAPEGSASDKSAAASRKSHRRK